MEEGQSSLRGGSVIPGTLCPKTPQLGNFRRLPTEAAHTLTLGGSFPAPNQHTFGNGSNPLAYLYLALGSVCDEHGHFHSLTSSMTYFKNPLAIGTSSLGLHPSHTLDRKIRAAATHGFLGLEIVYGDLQTYSEINNIPISTAAERIRALANDFGLEILSLCPFENFEGHKSLLHERLQVASHWMNLARILRATYIQIPAQYEVDANGDETLIISELQQLADLGASVEPVIHLAYEPMSWSTYCSTWEKALRLAELVDRPNFGICLDTFHIASKLWGSPSEPSGRFLDADDNLANSLQRFVNDFPLDRLAYVQLSDGEKFNPPYSENHPWYLKGEAPEFTWSKHARPFPLEHEFGGYLPVAEIVHAWIIEKGFTGWISLETFDRRMREPIFEVEVAATRAKRSIQKLQEALRFAKARV